MPGNPGTFMVELPQAPCAVTCESLPLGGIFLEQDNLCCYKEGEESENMVVRVLVFEQDDGFSFCTTRNKKGTTCKFSFLIQISSMLLKHAQFSNSTALVVHKI